MGVQPHWILWYLLSLFVWKTIAPIINHFRFPLALSIIIAISAGYCESIGYFLGLSRTIVFFPFFLIGLNQKSHLEHFHCSNLMKLASVFILIAAFFMFLKIPTAQPGWFYGSYPYSVFKLMDWHASIYRFCTYLLSTTLILAFLCLVPSKQTSLSRLGINTLMAYVWGGLLVKIFKSFDVMSNLLASNVYLYLAVTLAIAIVMVYFCSLNIVQSLTVRYVLTPIEKLVFDTNPNK